MSKVLQNIFDTAVMGVLTQGKPSMNSKGTCLYRGPDNCKCAAGHLIPDDKYKPKFEGRSVYHEIWSAIGIDDRHYKIKRFVQLLQAAHDTAANRILGPYVPEEDKNKQFLIWFCKTAIDIAKDNKLDYSKANGFLKGLEANAT